MIRTALLLVATASFGVALACDGQKSTASASAATAVAPDTNHAFLQVDGVTCHGTASVLHAALMELEGVENASVEPTGKVDIAYDPARTDPDRLLAAVSNIDGYEAHPAEAPRTN